MTNKTISLTIPNDDPIALHEFGAALQRMAHSHGLEQATPLAVAVEIRPERKAAIREAMTHDIDKAQLTALGEAVEIVKAAAPALMDDKFKYDGEEAFGPRTDTTPSHLDSDGLPWDARIHASSKERNSDGTWRARRKPADMDAGQWAEFQGQVRTELRALMAVPVEQEVAVVLDEQPVEVTLGEPKVASLTPSGELSVGYVVKPIEPEPIVVTPPPVVDPVAPVVDPVAPVVEPVAPVVEPVAPVVEPVAPVVEPVAPPPVVVTPPPVAAGPTEFVPFLQWVTGNGYTPVQVNAALAKHGLTAVPQLQQRPDLIPQVHATLAAGV